MFYPRRILLFLKKHLQQPELTVLTGMRRTGKTTIINYLFDNLTTKNKIFLDLESRINREIFESDDYEEIFFSLKNKYGLTTKKKIYIFLDEIQYLKNLVSVMKYLYDHYQIKFIVSGSSSFYLKNLFSESLSGRKQIFELFPLTFDEFLIFKKKIKNFTNDSLDFSKIKKNDWWQKSYDKLFEEYLRFGGFPQVVLEENLEKKIVLLKDILYSYIETDVKNLSNFRHLSEMEKLIKILTGRIGQKLDVSKISREISIARATLMEYLTFLEKTYFIFLVRPYGKNIDRQIAKAPKIYFCDNGLANILSFISSGQVLENAVFQALKVKYQFKQVFSEINYYQRRSGAEIDFIVDNIAIEVKETVQDFDLKKIAAFSKKLKLKEYFLVSKNISHSQKTFYVSQL